MTVDADRGLLFAATGSPTADFYGADRKGRNLYGNSLLALDATTGSLRWFQQLVHHDIWDWDLPAAPTLIEVQRNGRTIAAVAQMTKMSTLFVFDRVTGEPVFGMEERPVPSSDVPGEATSPTQPFPVQPPPLARTTFDPGRRPLHAHARAREILPRAVGHEPMYTKGMFTPPGLDGTMVMFPSTLGGGNWSGLSYDAGRGLLITNIMNLAKWRGWSGARRRAKAARILADVAVGNCLRALLESGDQGALLGAAVRGAGCSGCQPRRGRVARPARCVRGSAARGFANTGTPNMGGTITTASGLIFIGATIDRRFRAFDERQRPSCCGRPRSTPARTPRR